MNHGVFWDQPWRGNDSGNDPGPFRLDSGDTVDTAHTVRLPDVFVFRIFFFSALREIII